MKKHNAIFKLYPNVVSIRENDAFDSEGNKVEYDEASVQAEMQANSYKQKRAVEYPSFADYLDGVVKGDQQQIDKYIADCLAVKAKYPKE